MFRQPVTVEAILSQLKLLLLCTYLYILPSLDYLLSIYLHVFKMYLYVYTTFKLPAVSIFKTCLYILWNPYCLLSTYVNVFKTYLCILQNLYYSLLIYMYISKTHWRICCQHMCMFSRHTSYKIYKNHC